MAEKIRKSHDGVTLCASCRKPIENSGGTVVNSYVDEYGLIHHNRCS